jgi:hypothetical protein
MKENVANNLYLKKIIRGNKRYIDTEKSRIVITSSLEYSDLSNYLFAIRKILIKKMTSKSPFLD